ncbi:MAG: Nudix family hydrolase [Acidiferrobacterales bacterium]
MPNIGPDGYLKVIVGVIEDGDANILLARRPSHLHQGGKWEFPGGKIEPGEEPIDALRRELDEELGIAIDRATPLIQVPYHYKTLSVLLDVWRVQNFAGEAVGREGQEIVWVPKDDLASMEFPPANHAILAALNLPAIYAISAMARYGEEHFLRVLETALNSGLKLLQLRERQLEKDAYLDLAAIVVDRCHHYGAKVLLNCEPQWIVGTAADGVHMTQERMMSVKHRPLGDEFLVAASCHDESSLQQAAMINADFVVLSPVQETVSHPGAKAIGWQRFQQLCAITALPVYALGGMALSGVVQARQYGAQGVALVTGIWEADDRLLARYL